MSRAAIIEEIIEFLEKTPRLCLEDLLDKTSYGHPEKIEEAFLNEFKMSDALLHFLSPSNVKLPSGLTREQRLEFLKLNPSPPSELSYPFVVADIRVNGEASDVDARMRDCALQVTQEEINAIRRFILQRLSTYDWNVVAAEYFSRLN
jgi:hypothetical protein